MSISICIPTFNQELFLEQAVRSAALQTIPPSEIIVSNDCSTDNTANLLYKLKLEIPNLIILNQSVNLGIARNVDICLRMAKSEYIIRLDSDDVLSAHYAEELLNLLKKYPDAGYAHAAVQEIDKNNQFLNLRNLNRKSVYLSGDEALEIAVKGYKVAANIIMFRKKALEAANYINTTVNFAEDYYLTASISAIGYGNTYNDNVLSFYRVWSDEKMVRQKRKLEEIIGVRKVFEEVLEPAFTEHNWRLQKVNIGKCNFACTLSDSLTWNIYSSEEKYEIQAELLKLSSAPKLKMVVWLYNNGFGIVLIELNKLKKSLISLVKKTRQYKKNWFQKI